MPNVVYAGGNKLLDALVRECGALQKGLERVGYRVGHVVALQDRPLDHVYFPLGGSLLSLLVVLEGGGSAEAMVVSSEGMVGLSVWLGVKASLAQIVQQAPGPLLRVPGRAFREAIAGSDFAAMLLKRFTAYSLRSGYQTAVCNAHHSIEQRTCRWILATADRVNRNEFILSQAMVAHMLGARRQSVGLAAVKLQDERLIAYHRTRFRLLDRAGLERRACECHRSLQLAYQTLVQSVL